MTDRKIIEDLANNLPWESLFDKIREVTNIPDLKFDTELRKNYCGEYYTCFRSQDIVEHIGLLSLMIKKLYIGQGSTGIGYNSTTGSAYWWGYVDFQYTHHPNGHNGHSFMHFRYDTLAGWTFELEKDRG